MTREPVLHLLAGPNGSGKSTYVTLILSPSARLPFVNADLIAARRWPGQEVEKSYAAAKLAEQERVALMRARQSFIAESVFSHPSKVNLVRDAVASGYQVSLHVMIVPLVLTQRRVIDRVETGGHFVPEDKIATRYVRLWPLVIEAATIAQSSWFFDNSSPQSPYRLLGRVQDGEVRGVSSLPQWTPDPVREFLTRTAR